MCHRPVHEPLRALARGMRAEETGREHGRGAHATGVEEPLGDVKGSRPRIIAAGYALAFMALGSRGSRACAIR